MNQAILDRAVQIATKCAMHGNPVDSIQWIPPSTPAQDPMGVFVIHYALPLSGADIPSWEK